MSAEAQRDFTSAGIIGCLHFSRHTWWEWDLTARKGSELAWAFASAWHFWPDREIKRTSNINQRLSFGIVSHFVGGSVRAHPVLWLFSSVPFCFPSIISSISGSTVKSVVLTTSQKYHTLRYLTGKLLVNHPGSVSNWAYVVSPRRPPPWWYILNSEIC